jgi:hypothetical protein
LTYALTRDRGGAAALVGSAARATGLPEPLVGVRVSRVGAPVWSVRSVIPGVQAYPRDCRGRTTSLCRRHVAYVSPCIPAVRGVGGGTSHWSTT